MKIDTQTQLMLDMFEAAVDVARPRQFMSRARDILTQHIEGRDKGLAGRMVVVGCGKASAAMAQSFEDIVPQELKSGMDGLVIVPDGHEMDTQNIEIVLASHPVPDERGATHTQRMLSLAEALGPDDLMVVLISGGGSSLLCLPQPQITLSEKQDITQKLLTRGAPIHEMNAVRKHLSQIKGGRLAAAAYPAPTLSFGISDVPHDDISVIASGPTVADATSCKDALDILSAYQIEINPQMRQALLSGEAESVSEDDERLSRADYHLLASPSYSLKAAARVARGAGYEPVILGDSLEGEARELAAQMAVQAIQAGPGKALISGGETTVKVRGTGVGGRNVEFLHALASDYSGYGLAADTDGIDGGAAVAGAVIRPDTAMRARDAGIDMQALLDNNDSHSFFAALDDQIITGPTHTNVNDFRVILT